MKRQDFELVRGDTWIFRDAEIALESGNLESPGVSSSISIKLSPKDTTALIEVAGVVEDETTASWTLSAAQTDALPESVLSYEIKITAGDVVTTVWGGAITVRPWGALA